MTLTAIALTPLIVALVANAIGWRSLRAADLVLSFFWGAWSVHVGFGGLSRRVPCALPADALTEKGELYRATALLVEEQVWPSVAIVSVVFLAMAVIGWGGPVRRGSDVQGTGGAARDPRPTWVQRLRDRWSVSMPSLTRTGGIIGLCVGAASLAAIATTLQLHVLADAFSVHDGWQGQPVPAIVLWPEVVRELDVRVMGPLRTAYYLLLSTWFLLGGASLVRQRREAKGRLDT